MKRLLFPLALLVATAAEADELAQLMADGTPWNMEDPSVRKATLTLNPDGTGRVRLGFMGAAADWFHTDDGLCLTTRPLGEVCLSLEPGKSRVVGTAPDGSVFVFSR